ncbi:TetR/AcrR family transcriptional regulator [Nocardia shimofusensis]|uniref:TetR/AcrR family transcriptional regulator n=1 Tax=Nocardia shimofusensis TaxID=228596 RepID=UPI00083527B4|nr:TetR family transcriptional regulator [Nocardia shimofusensis]
MTPRSGRRRDRAATRTALLDAARRRFARQGFDSTGVREIAADVGVDPALVFRYFGSKKQLYAEAIHMEIPTGLAADRHRPVAHLADQLLRDVVFADQSEYGGEHPLLAMLRSANRDEIRDQLRTHLCEDYLDAVADRIPTPDAALRAELVGALLLGLGVMRSVIETPALTEAPFEHTRVLTARMIIALTS